MADVKKLNNMFLVNAPAGSGKTTYIENTIINLLAQYPNRRILSITYTNRAKEELNSRINSKNVTVDTIHSFLSDFVGLYFSKPEVIDLYLQVFEKKIKALIDNGEDDSKNARYIDKFGKLDFETIKNNLHKVFYNEQSYSSYYYGGLSHDDMLLFCRKMFEKFEMLKKRLSNKYRYIFIDEYQDTSADVLYIFYQSVLNTSSTLYLLGDKMQEMHAELAEKVGESRNQIQRYIRLRVFRIREKLVISTGMPFSRRALAMQPAKKDFPVPTSPQMRSPEAFALISSQLLT